jgi:hypothetical protein
MSLRDTWGKAKAQSKKDFKTACKAKQEDLAKKAKGGDQKAKDKFVRGALDEMGLLDDEDPDKFFKFKADLGPNLDKVEKQLGAFAQVLAERKKLTGARVLSDNALLEKARKFYVGKSTEHLFNFLAEIDNLDSAAAYKKFVQGPPFDKFQNLPAVAPLVKTKGDPAALKTANADKLFKDLKAFVVKDLAPRLDKGMEGGKGGLAQALVPGPPAFEAAVDGACAAATTYLKAIMDSKSKWPDPKPDFRKPLIDALDEIDTVLQKVM